MMKLIDKWAPSQSPYAVSWSTERFGRWKHVGREYWEVEVNAIKAGCKNGRVALSYGTVSASGTGPVPESGSWWPTWDNRYGLTTNFKYSGNGDIWYDTAWWMFGEVFENLESMEADWQRLPAVPEGYTGWYYHD